jgi:hypothetical protein
MSPVRHIDTHLLAYQCLSQADLCEGGVGCLATGHPGKFSFVEVGIQQGSSAGRRSRRQSSARGPARESALPAVPRHGGGGSRRVVPSPRTAAASGLPAVRRRAAARNSRAATHATTGSTPATLISSEPRATSAGDASIVVRTYAALLTRPEGNAAAAAHTTQRVSGLSRARRAPQRQYRVLRAALIALSSTQEETDPTACVHDPSPKQHRGMR